MSDEAKLLSGIFDAAVDAIIVSDGVGHITRVNKAAAKMFGYDPNALLGQDIKILMPQDTKRQHDGYMSHHIETGEKRIIGIGREVEGLRSDGTVFPLHLSVGRANVEDELMFIAILHDLTSRKSTELALARSQRLDALGQMTGGIAHDFNNLLTVVIGNLELLEMRIQDPKNLTMLKDALEAAELGADLTSRMMVFARKTGLKPTISDLNEVLDTSLGLLTRSLSAFCEISTQCEPALSPVALDATQFHTAIANLALNAKDAMPKGGKLKFTTENVEIDDNYVAQETDIEPGSYVRLSIADNGEGMSPEAQKRAFEPFFTTKGSAHGTGLGLAMVYGFIRQSNGHITLYSEPGIGTTFAMYFPALKDAVSATAASKSLGSSPTGRGQIILVVEDNPKVRALSMERIKDLGYQVREAESGDIAYEMLQNGLNVDLIFSDIVMPGVLNGFELAQKVNSEFPKIKVLLTSGYANDFLDQDPDGRASIDVLQKPYRQQELAARLQAIFG